MVTSWFGRQYQSQVWRPLFLGPNGELLAEARLFHAELITASNTPDMLRSPDVFFADLDETPKWLKPEVVKLLEE